MGTLKPLSPEVRALVEALRAALDVPYPADLDQWQAYSFLLDRRVSRVLGSLDHLAHHERVDLASAAEVIASVSVNLPPQYIPAQTEEDPA